MSIISMPDALPPEVLDFLVRTLPSRAFWAWLNEESQAQLRARVTQGFRATPEVLRQPAARSRLVSHLQSSESDFESLLKLWGETAPKILETVRAQESDELLIAQLPVLQALHGVEALILALLHEEREAVLEALAELDETSEATPEVATEESAPAVNTAALEKQLQRAQIKVEQLRAKAHDTKTRAAQTEKVLQDKLKEQERAAREAIREARQAALRIELLESKFAEAEKARDRAERKTRSTQIESETAQAEAKTLRRQIHRLQQINEELRRRLSAPPSAPTPTTAKAEISPPETSKAGTSHPGASQNRTSKTSTGAPHTRGAVSPGHLPGLRISLAEWQTAVDRNAEAVIASTVAEVEALREQDPTKASEVVKAIRGLGRYYERVLCHPTTRVLVDASNVARHDGPGKGKLSYLRAMRDELRSYDFFPILFVADASLPYHIDTPDEFRRMMKTGEIMISASGQEADEILARMARETGAYVVTNDRNFHRHLAPAFTPLRVGFQIFDNVVVLEEF